MNQDVEMLKQIVAALVESRVRLIARVQELERELGALAEEPAPAPPRQTRVRPPNGEVTHG